jgi:glycosyltransferase involved in cell wall biosynthesis
MATLVCAQLPLDPPGRTSGASIVGARVHQSSFLRALLKYGSCDRYIFVDRNAVHATRRGEPPWRADDRFDRACVATLPELIARPPDGPIVLMTPDPSLHGLYGLQRLLGRFDAPCVGMVHSLHGSHLLAGLLGSLLQERRSADALVASSDAGRTVVQRQIAHLVRAGRLTEMSAPFRCPVIPLGVDAEYFEPPDRDASRRRLGLGPDDVALVSVGRFSSRTKADLRPLLVAFSQLRALCRAPVRLYLAGDDTQERESRSLLAFCGILGIEPHVRLRPQLRDADKRALLGAADIFVAPSDNVQETFGLAVVEAMAAGLPVVAADWNGFRETVVHGETGFLVPTCMPAYDDPIEAMSAAGGTLAESLTAQTTAIDLGELVRTLALLVDDRILRRRLGEQGRQRAERLYHLREIVAAHERLWTELLAETPVASATANPTPLFSYPCAEVFGHYATTLLSDDDRLAITPFGESCVNESGGDLLAAIAGRERMVRRADLERVLLAVRDAGVTSVRCLAATTTRFQAFAQRIAVARLLKFGALRRLVRPEA